VTKGLPNEALRRPLAVETSGLKLVLQLMLTRRHDEPDILVSDAASCCGIFWDSVSRLQFHQERQLE
jgi:hypothetical protein